MGPFFLLLTIAGFSLAGRPEWPGFHSVSLTSTFKAASIQPLPSFLLLPQPLTAVPPPPAGWICSLSSPANLCCAEETWGNLAVISHFQFMLTPMSVNAPLSCLAGKPPPGVSQDTVLPYLRGCSARSHNGLASCGGIRTGEESENRKASRGNSTIVLRHGDKIQAGLSTGVVLGVVWGQDHSI